MKTKFAIIALLIFLACNQIIFAQKTIKEYVTKNDAEKIKKSILIDVFSKPITNKGFADGHGKTPYFTSFEQLPDTIALIAFNINDLGLTVTDFYSNSSAFIYTTYYYVSAEGGNEIANKIHEQTIESLKQEFKKQGVVLLTPSEFLNTPEKESYYNKEFMPSVSKLGKFFSNIENRNTDISVSADYYRPFDMGAAFDHLRSESLGYDLANKLGVDGVLSIGIEIQSNKKEAYVRAVKMALHGPNPNAKEDKKYVAQNAGNGYYNGQLYVGGTFRFKDPIKSIEMGKEQITSMDFDGFEIIFENFIGKFYDEINTAINKVTN